MSIKNLSKTFIGAIIFSFILGVTVLFAGGSKAEKGIGGVWQFNQRLSDDATGRLRSDMSKLPSPVKSVPNQLILADDEKTGEITINEGFDKILRTQTLPTDGTIVAAGPERDEQFPARAFWQNGKLIVEYKMPQTGKITETFELSDDQNQLKIVWRVESLSRTKPLIIKRVYDRTAVEEEQLPAETEAEINIVGLPL